jgi:hypothetical protein
MQILQIYTEKLTISENLQLYRNPYFTGFSV